MSAPSRAARRARPSLELCCPVAPRLAGILTTRTERPQIARWRGPRGAEVLSADGGVG